ncbi:hypothetical protein CDAR_60181 [Caerostris darwini]|uniref:Uncharacterized protein n=1 Tax=Caerostris darwini TaxID=1538125 RepID=A0AAV4QNW9_9ARAC|nr:hypothetical protein CDAR_60181 [Caerostris darwini]
MRLKQTSQELSATISPLRRENPSDPSRLRLSHFSTFCQKRHRHFIIHTRTHLLHPHPQRKPSRSKTVDDRAPRFTQGRIPADGRGGAFQEHGIECSNRSTRSSLKVTRVRRFSVC